MFPYQREGEEEVEEEEEEDEGKCTHGIHTSGAVPACVMISSSGMRGTGEK